MRAAYSTKSRLEISNLLKEAHRYLTASDVYQRLKKTGSKASLSTVYRTLEHMQASGQASARAEAGGEASYVFCEPEQHHHHAICRVCGRVQDIACAAIEHLAHDLLAHHKFSLDDHEMEFYGTCASCG